ncbi:ankyrin repeat-containing domain protein [Penicillium malachiteum]|uniref:Ankyrin repeat-containing domain protein n=1 Tax=Penicillium malachiteum TaxID=1324776 RepID=A0AAD6MZS2_9EURO|nr:ankyrin repeat-containing domain protein [Penicillium malachiteum]
MDPLSIGASVIAIATLATQTCSAISDLRSLCQSLPGRLHAVNNEVADLNLVLFQVSLLIESRACFSESRLSAIPHLLHQAEKELVEVKEIVGQLTTACRASRNPFLRAHSWRKEQSRLQDLQANIKNIKANLNIMLGASNSQDMTRIRLDIESISTITIESSQQQTVLKDDFLSGLAAVDRRIAHVEEILLKQSSRVQESQLEQVGSSYNMTSPRRPRPQLQANEGITGIQQSDGVGFRVTPFAMKCRPGCLCACHSQRKMASPKIWSRVLGQLFIDFAGLPFFKQKCDLETCCKSHSSQLSLEYWFPMGFLSSTIIRLHIRRQPNIGLWLQLDTIRRVPDTAQCVSFALNGDIDGLKYLFSNGLASPRDVSTTRGYSILRWALYGKQYETCEFLIHAGADPDYRPIAPSDNSPRNKACHFLLEGKLSNTALCALRTVAKGGYLEDFIDEARFTKIHKTVLTLSSMNLEEEIRQNREDINAVDAMGRTPLAWAAARGDTRSIVTLLGHGADPNITDVQLSGPLSNAAAQGYSVAVRLLLEAGAHTDLVHPSGEKKGSPLNCAARNATDVLLLKNLLDFGADVDASGNDGRTALAHAARTDNASFAMLLLEYGANINSMACDGSTPLTTAIIYNSHNVLSLFLDRWHEYSVCPRLKGPNLLQLAALYADCKTLQTLASTDHLKRKYDKQYTLGDFNNSLKERPDLSDDLAVEFDNLLNVVNELPVDPQHNDSHSLGSGIPSWCLMRGNSELEDVCEGSGSACSDGSFRDAFEFLPQRPEGGVQIE